jgi:hypothetical protein
LSYAATPTGQGSKGEITGNEAAAMVACGVNLFGFDQLHPGDARLARAVWSWSPWAWASGDCAYSGSDGRFHGDPCANKKPVACQNPTTGAWTVTTKPVTWKQAAKACKTGEFAVPATGWENTQLVAAKRTAGVGEVWLAYAKVGDTWTPRATSR